MEPVMPPPRNGSIVMCPQRFSTPFVGKIMKIVERQIENEEEGVMIKIAVVKLHYNGEMFMVPLHQLRKATDQEKKADKKNENYWKNQSQNISGVDIRYVTGPVQFFSRNYNRF
tara:strand:+ start:67 stop:408 length:342 start_codon:yes stop_codon:yes gene_type:complete